MLRYIIDLTFTTYTFLLLIRIVGSWFPRFAESRFMHFVSFYTDPYLNLFKKVVPPIGMLDISPMFAFISLQLMEVLVHWILK